MGSLGWQEWRPDFVGREASRVRRHRVVERYLPRRVVACVGRDVSLPRRAPLIRRIVRHVRHWRREALAGEEPEEEGLLRFRRLWTCQRCAALLRLQGGRAIAVVTHYWRPRDCVLAIPVHLSDQTHRRVRSSLRRHCSAVARVVHALPSVTLVVLLSLLGPRPLLLNVILIRRTWLPGGAVVQALLLRLLRLQVMLRGHVVLLLGAVHMPSPRGEQPNSCLC
mmetsp:Transcript_1403/g.3233  ORF Transcript_1403/g.3233 Transcript_1403/m.3233 type:complete len:223 (+) Transcript_1403:788-1456(+)